MGRRVTAADRDNCARKVHRPSRRWALSDARAMRGHYSRAFVVYVCPACKQGWLVGSVGDGPARGRS